MGAIIFEITALVVVLAFVVFLALDDRKNRKIREEEDRLEALKAQQGGKDKE